MTFFFELTADRHNEQARCAILSPANRRWRPLEAERLDKEDDPSSRYSTPAPVSLDSAEENGESKLVIRFSKLFDTKRSQNMAPFDHGILFGADEKICHIVLPRGAGLSSKHCGLLLDRHLRVKIEDFSSYGTAIQCNDQNGDSYRTNKEWYLTRPVQQQQAFDRIVICIRGIRMKIHFPNHSIVDPRYEENLRTFLALLVEDADSLAALRIDSAATTMAPSGTVSPRPADIYYQLNRLGEGEFASVYQAFSAKTGETFAMKVFSRAQDKRRRSSAEPKWLESIRKEFNLLRDHRHVSGPIDIFLR